ncbi:MAG: hypothetical protein K0Q90_2908 [Paenibacillaceae bacterium]|jgi:hypothetical protein|nr:hypothetical protein [Paenibacillaceae bacterium]
MKTRYSTASLLMTGKAHEVRRMLRLLLDQSSNPHMPLLEQLDQNVSVNPEITMMRQAAFRIYSGSNVRPSALPKEHSR